MADVMQPPKGGEPDTPEQKKPVPLVNDGLSPSDVDFIPPLVHSLVTLLRLRGKSVSTAFLMAGLAGTGRVSPGACLHAAKRAGLEGKIVYRKSLQDISTLVLPCILLLSRDRSCVLTSLDDGKAGVIFPETGEGVQPVPLQMLADEYTGYAFSPRARPGLTSGPTASGSSRGSAGSGTSCSTTCRFTGMWPSPAWSST